MSCLSQIDPHARVACGIVETATGAFFRPGGMLSDSVCLRIVDRIKACKAGEPMASSFISMRPVVRRADSFAPALGQSASSARSRAEASALKMGGGGSTSTGTRKSTVGDLGGLIGDAFGGESGRTIGTALGEAAGSLFGRDRPSVGATGFAPSMGGCPEGTLKVGDRCVDPSAILPGGAPGVIPMPGTQIGGGGGTVEGAFGIPARQPRIETRVHRSCGRGMVLGEDNLCYPKAVLPRRSQYRKWKGATRPPISGADMKAIRKASSAKDRVLELAKDVGLHASKSAHKRRK